MEPEGSLPCSQEPSTGPYSRVFKYFAVYESSLFVTLLITEHDET
jgi:hypothetical protein